MRRAWTSNPDYPPCRYRAVDVKSRAVKRIVDWTWDALVLIKYPKLVMLALVTVVAFALFRDDGVQSFFHELGDMEYLSAFFGGMLFAFGFGAPFGVAILLTISGDVNLLAAGVIAGTGALVSDLLLFKFVRMTFQDEIDRLLGSKAFAMLDGLMRRRLPPRVAFYISLGVAGLVISSPLPDEFGVVLMAGLTKVSMKVFAAMCFALNTAGILVVLGVGKLF